MHRFRVALIDDHEIVTRGFAELFSTLPGIHVVATVATVSALLESNSPTDRIDLVILDLCLSDVSTVTSNVERLREIGAEVLAFTAGDDAQLMRVMSRILVFMDSTRSLERPCSIAARIAVRCLTMLRWSLTSAGIRHRRVQPTHLSSASTAWS